MAEKCAVCGKGIGGFLGETAMNDVDLVKVKQTGLDFPQPMCQACGNKLVAQARRKKAAEAEAAGAATAKYEYKIIPAPMIISIRSEKDIENAFESFSKAINRGAWDGWEFHGMETLIIHTDPGYLAKTFGFKEETKVQYNMLVFKRLKEKTPESQ